MGKHKKTHHHIPTHPTIKITPPSENQLLILPSSILQGINMGLVHDCMCSHVHPFHPTLTQTNELIDLHLNQSLESKEIPTIIKRKKKESFLLTHLLYFPFQAEHASNKPKRQGAARSVNRTLTGGGDGIPRKRQAVVVFIVENRRWVCSGMKKRRELGSIYAGKKDGREEGTPGFEEKD